MGCCAESQGRWRLPRVGGEAKADEQLGDNFKDIIFRPWM
jgi:hypothetical protein